MDPSLSKALLCLLEYLKVGALFLIIIRCGGIANSSFLFRCLRFQYLLNSPMDTSLLCIKAYMDPSLLPCKAYGPIFNAYGPTFICIKASMNPSLLPYLMSFVCIEAYKPIFKAYNYGPITLHICIKVYNNMDPSFNAYVPICRYRRLCPSLLA